MTKFRILVGVVLSMLPFSTATDCGAYNFSCIDFSGLEIDFQLHDLSSCTKLSDCGSVDIPDYFRVAVSNEPWFPNTQCEIHRAELVSKWDGIVIGEPSDLSPPFRYHERFVAVHEATLEDTGCSGILTVYFFTSRFSGSKARAWLKLGDERTWFPEATFVPDPIEECSTVTVKSDSCDCAFDAAEAE